MPDGYVDYLSDELAPLGLEFDAVLTADGVTSICFRTDPESFAVAHPWLAIDESYGDRWPPESLYLWLRFDADANPIELTFEVFDLLVWAAAVDYELHQRLNTFDDPADHAEAVGEALAALLAPPVSDEEFLA